MTRLLRELIAAAASLTARVVLFCVFLPLIAATIQLIGPYEDVGNVGTQQLPIKVIKVDENNKLYLAWCCYGKDGHIVDYDHYIAALKNNNGIVGADEYRATYSLEITGPHETTVTLHNGGYFFVYDVRGDQLYPVKRKMLVAWKVIVSLVGAVLMVSLTTRLARRMMSKRTAQPTIP